MDHLLRDLAPIPEAAWAAIEEEATSTLRTYLAARKLVELSGPEGWQHSSVNAGRADPLADGPHDGVEAARRVVWPLVELRSRFAVSRRIIDQIERGRPDVAADLGPVTEAAQAIALAEDTAVFHGYEAGEVGGITGVSEHDPLTIPAEESRYPRLAALAVERLREAAVDGPYAIALGQRCYTDVIESTEHGGYPVLEHLHLIVDGPVIWAPAVQGAVIMSQRGGDFSLVSGQDFAIGYDCHDGDAVHLYLEESIWFQVNDPAAAIALVHQR